jgi:hypothetical protein
VENGTDVRARLAQVEEDFLTLSNDLRETGQLHALAAQKLATYLLALTAEVMTINEELIAADTTGRSETVKARERLRDIFKKVETVMKAMKDVADHHRPPEPPQ